MLAALRRFLRIGNTDKTDIDRTRLPRHIAIIMDGNGRWAKKRGLPRIAGHRAGAKVIREIVEESAGIGIDWLTLYAFSAENWRRPKNEVLGIMRLFEEILQSELEELHSNNIKINVIGDLDGVVEGAKRQFEKAIERTKCNTGLNLTIAINYGGRADILNAVNSLIKAGEKEPVDDDSFRRALSTASMPDPELIIRTSGEMRLSNFLVWEGAYSEFWVTDTLWPDFNAGELSAAVSDYVKRDRRFGGIN